MGAKAGCRTRPVGKQEKNKSPGLSPKAPMKKQQGQRQPKKAQKANGGGNAMTAKATSGDIQLSGRRPRRTVSTPKRYEQIKEEEPRRRGKGPNSPHAARRRGQRANSPDAAQQQVQLVEHVVMAAEADAIMEQGLEGGGGGGDGGGDMAEGGSPALVDTQATQGRRRKMKLKKRAQPCCACGSQASTTWRYGQADGPFSENLFCNPCGVRLERYGAERDPVSGQIVFPESPRGRGRGRREGAAVNVAAAALNAADALLRAAEELVGQEDSGSRGNSSAEHSLSGSGGTSAATCAAAESSASEGCSEGQWHGNRNVAKGAESGCEEPQTSQEADQQLTSQVMAGQLDNSPALRTRGKKRHAAEVSSAHMPAQQERKVIKLTADSRSAAYAAGVQHVSRDMPMLESDESGQHGLEGASSEEEQEGIELLMGFCGADE